MANLYLNKNNPNFFNDIKKKINKINCRWKWWQIINCGLTETTDGKSGSVTPPLSASISIGEEDGMEDV